MSNVPPLEETLIPGLFGGFGSASLPASPPYVPVSGPALPVDVPRPPVDLPAINPNVFLQPPSNNYTGQPNAIGQVTAQAVQGIQQTQSEEARREAIRAAMEASQGGSSGGGGSNNGARAAAFNAQRDAQVNAYAQQISDLEGQLQNYLTQVQEMQQNSIQGVNKQTQIAKSATRKERNTAEGVISQDLLGLLELLGQSQLATQAEGAATTQAIGNRALSAAEAQNADTQRFAQLGGGDRLAAAALEGQDTSRQLSSIDQALAARLSQAASADSNRRQGSARQVASGANQNLAANAAQILSQITAQAASERTALRQTFAERKLDAQQSYAQQISDARFAQSQAAAQRYIPTATSGGSRSTAKTYDQRIAEALGEQVFNRDVQDAMAAAGLVQPEVSDPYADYINEFAANGGLEGLTGAAQADSAANNGDIGPILDVLKFASSNIGPR